MEDGLYHLRIDTPVGPLLISGTAHFINAVSFTDKPAVDFPQAPALLLDCAQQLYEYFAGDRKTFDLPISQEGTEFQQTVWQQLTVIPFGQTISYQQLARRIENRQGAGRIIPGGGRRRTAVRSQGPRHPRQPRRIERQCVRGARRHDRRQPRLGNADQAHHHRAGSRQIVGGSDAAARLNEGVNR